MSVEQSGHQPWLYEPGTADSLDEPPFDAFGERTLITPPVEPAVAAPEYETSGRHHTPAWAHEPYTEVEAFTAPIHTLEPAFGEPLYAQVLTERDPSIAAGQAARPSHKPAATGIHVMSLQDRGPLVKDGEPGSIFDSMNKERSTRDVPDYYAELRRPYHKSPPSFERMTVAEAPKPAVPAQETAAPKPATTQETSQEITVITPVKAIEPAVPRASITVKGEQEGSVAAVIEEEQSGLDKQEAAAFLTRVLRGLEKSRDADLAIEAAEAAQAVKFQAEAARTNEQTPVTVREEHLTLSGIRAAAKEVITSHKKAARIAEYAGVAVVAVAAGARLLGRFRRR